jgi:hypothetical protein
LVAGGLPRGYFGDAKNPLTKTRGQTPGLF